MEAAAGSADDAMEDGDRSSMLAEVAAGFGRSQKEISSKYFYDHRGSQLFDAITRLPEYYLTRAERALLDEWATGRLEESPFVSLVELGAGSGDKTRILLAAILARWPRATYVPVDISARFLEGAAAALRSEFHGLEVRPVVADMTQGLRLPRTLKKPVLFALLGGTIGNFPSDRAAALLGRVRHAMGPRDRLLLGVDLIKDTHVLEAAYNDSHGITAEFNRNALLVLNRELGTDFDVARFQHRAFYNRTDHRIEMHLVALRPMVVTLPGAGTFDLEQGETIRTEISCKYDRARVEALFRAGGLSLERWLPGSDGFALAEGGRS
jgi:L-histidine Nalpha-methyltransferase